MTVLTVVTVVTVMTLVTVVTVMTVVTLVTVVTKKLQKLQKKKKKKKIPKKNYQKKILQLTFFTKNSKCDKTRVKIVVTVVTKKLFSPKTFFYKKK